MSPWQSWGMMLLLVILVALVVYIIDYIRRPTVENMHVFYVDPNEATTSYAAHVSLKNGLVYSVKVNDFVFRPEEEDPYQVEAVGPYRIGVRNTNTKAYHEFNPEGFIKTFEVTPLNPHTPRHASR